MKLIIEPADGVAPLLAAIKRAKKSVEIAIFRLDRKDVEMALTAAAARGVRVTALIAFANRGGEKRLRQLELRFLGAGIIVARTSDDLVRYHGKYILIDRRVLYVLSFNFTHLDIDRSRGFGVVTSQPDQPQRSGDAVQGRLHADPVCAEGRDVRREPGEFPFRPRHVPEAGEEAAADLRPDDLGQGDAADPAGAREGGRGDQGHRQGVGTRPRSRSRSWRAPVSTRARSSATGARPSSAARACELPN